MEPQGPGYWEGAVNEERVNTEHPTVGEEDLSDEHRSRGRVASGVEAGDDGDESMFASGSVEPGSARPVKNIVVSTRLDESGSEDFALVKSALVGRKSSSSDAVRKMVEIVAADLRGEKYRDASRAQELRTVDLDENTIASLKESLDRNATGYSDAIFQFQKIGNNVNQLARSANSGDRVPAAALKQVSRRLGRIEELLNYLAESDGARSRMLRGWL